MGLIKWTKLWQAQNVVWKAKAEDSKKLKYFNCCCSRIWMISALSSTIYRPGEKTQLQGLWEVERESERMCHFFCVHFIRWKTIPSHYMTDLHTTHHLKRGHQLKGTSTKGLLRGKKWRYQQITSFQGVLTQHREPTDVEHVRQRI